jgi:O-antigen ligase
MTPVLILVALIALWRLRQRGGDWRDAFGTIPALFSALVMIWSAATLAWTIDFHESAEVWIQTLLLLATGHLVLAAAWPRETSAPGGFPRALAAGVMLALAIGAVEVATGGFIVKHFLRIFFGKTEFTLVEMNRGAAVLTVAFWPALLALLRFGKRERVGAVCMVIVTAWVLYRLESTTAFLALAIGCATVAAGIVLRERIWMAAMVIAVLAAACFPPLAQYAFPKHTVESEYGWLPDSARHRLRIWQFASEKLAERPLTGWGMQSSKFIPGGNEEIQVGQRRLPLHPHNAFLQVWLELGVPGLILTLGWVLWLIRRVQQAALPFRERVLMLACIASAGLVCSMGFGIWQAWWLAALFLVAASFRTLARSSAIPTPGPV